MSIEKIKMITGAITGVGAVIVLGFSAAYFVFDGRYVQNDQAEETYLEVESAQQSFKQIGKALLFNQKQSERNSIENRLEILNLELKYLSSKPIRTTDDEHRMGYLRDQRRVLLERLVELRKTDE